MEEYVHVYDAGTLSVSPEWEVKDSGVNFEATSVEKVDLPDGTRATLRYMEPVEEMVNYGPQWEGEFERYGNTYTLTVPSSDPSGKDARQALSTMVLVSVSETSPQTGRTGTTPTMPWTRRPKPCSPGKSGHRRTNGSLATPLRSTT